MSCKEKVRCWIRRIGHSNKIQYRFDARSSTKSGSGAQSLIAHSADVYTERISRSFVYHTEKYSGSRDAEGLPSTKVRHEEQASAPEEEMVDVTVLVEDNRSVLTETEVNDSE